ncbi:MAG: pyridoxamine 5'-phosphate oxidase family protein [Clostridia bacterium]|nr:pyridoxamine 5'-phosphate oxidase family protein [Clostridia bacterium]
MRKMRQKARQVSDRAIICAMLDQMDTIYVGMHDGPYPYVVPLNFGYTFDDDLVFYFHCAKAGYKLDLLARNPHVCVTASQFVSYAGGSVRGHMHDYRSVIARGVAQQINPDREPEAFRAALENLLIHNHRDPADADSPVVRHIQMWRIVCKAEDVTAKAEIMPKRPAEVQFAPAVADGMPIDESHILDAHEE